MAEELITREAILSDLVKYYPMVLRKTYGTRMWIGQWQFSDDGGVRWHQCFQNNPLLDLNAARAVEKLLELGLPYAESRNRCLKYCSWLGRLTETQDGKAWRQPVSVLRQYTTPSA